MSKKTRSQKAARKTKTADFEIFEDRSPQVERVSWFLHQHHAPGAEKCPREHSDG